MKQVKVDFLHTPEYDWVIALPSPYAGILRALYVTNEAVEQGIIPDISITVGKTYKLYFSELLDEVTEECHMGRVLSNIVPLPVEYWHRFIPVRYRQVTRLLQMIGRFIQEGKITDFEVLLPSTTSKMSDISKSLTSEGNFIKGNLH